MTLSGLRRGDKGSFPEELINNFLFLNYLILYYTWVKQGATKRFLPLLYSNAGR